MAIPVVTCKPEIAVVDEVRTTLPPEQIFDLLVDPFGCLTWHGHPRGTVVAVDAERGTPAPGDRHVKRGMIAGAPSVSTTVVKIATRPTRYEVAWEVVLRSWLSPLGSYRGEERYSIAPSADGSVIRYEAEVARSWKSDPHSIVMRAVRRPAGPATLGEAWRLANRRLIAAAEQEAQRAGKLRST